MIGIHLGVTLVARPSGGGPGPVYDPDAEALFARATTQPSSNDKTAIDTAFKAMRAAGLLPKFDGLWIMGADTAQFARLNWIQPAFNLLPVNAPAFTVKGGFKGDGASSYFQFGANQDGWTKFTRDDAHLMLWAVELPTADAITEIGIYSGTDRARIRVTSPSNTAGPPGARINQASGVNAATVTRGTGMLLASRTNSSELVLYRNDDESEIQSIPSAALTASPMGLFKGNGTGAGSHSNARLVAASVGSGFTAGDKSNVFSIINTCLTSMGVPTS